MNQNIKSLKKPSVKDETKELYKMLVFTKVLLQTFRKMQSNVSIFTLKLKIVEKKAIAKRYVKNAKI